MPPDDTLGGWDTERRGHRLAGERRLEYHESAVNAAICCVLMRCFLRYLHTLPIQINISLSLSLSLRVQETRISLRYTGHQILFFSTVVPCGSCSGNRTHNYRISATRQARHVGQKFVI